MDLISLVVRRKLLVHLMVLILVVLGLWHYADMPRNFFPNAHMNQAWVVVPWPGASPLEVERQITDKLESAVADLEGLDELQSRSQQSKSVVGVFIEEGRDMDKVMMDLQTSVNSITDLPEDALDPLFLEIDASMIQPVCLIAMGGPLEENILLEVAEDMKKEFEDVPGVKSIDLQGLRDLEVRVSVDLDLLEHYRLSMGEILTAIGRQNVDFPGGKSEVAGRTQSLRVLGKYRDLQDLGNTVLRISPQGGVLRLKQLASVDLEIEDQHVLSRLNGEPSGTMIVFKTNEGNTLDIMDEVHLIVDRYNSSLPIPVFTEVRLDTAELIRERLGVMTNNAWLTAILVGVLLLFFLGWSNSLLVLFGIPFTFLVGFIFMNMAGMSINMLTLFAMIMALGIIVDDAIVVVDNVQRHIESGLDPVKAAIVGTREVMSPVISAVLTTVAGFMPVLFMTGMIGKFMSAIPKTIIFVLLASLVEALLVLPAHTAEISELNRYLRRRLGLKQRSVEGRGQGGSAKRNPVYLLLRKTYRKQLAFTLRHRYLALTSVIILAVASMGLLSVLPVRMFPSEDFDQITLQFEAASGTPLEETDLLTRELENLISQLPTEEVKAVVSSSGYQVRNHEIHTDSHLGEINIDLVSAADRSRSDLEIMKELRGLVAGVPGITRFSLERPSSGPPTGKPVEIHILGGRLEVLQELAGLLESALGEIEGVVDIRNNFEYDSREYNVLVDADRAASLGLGSRDIAMTVNAAFQGVEATQYTNPSGKELAVIVRLKEEQREKAETLDRLRLASPSGGQVPIANLASIAPSLGLRNIRHFERERAITITADLEGGTNSTAVNQIILNRFASFSTDYPGYRLHFGGEFEKTAESFRSLAILIPLAFLTIFMILAGQFNSLLQPLVVIFTVPFSFIGVVIGLIVMGYEFTVPAMVGIIALMGLVVNNSLVMVDFINKSRARGRGRIQSIVKSGVIRMRPILLTTITTITGLSTLTVASTGATKIMVPMAVSMIWGLAFATLLTLFLVPALIAILDDLKTRAWRKKG